MSALRRVYSGMMVAAVAASLFAGGCGRQDAETEPVLELVPVPVTRGDVTAVLETKGLVVAPPNEYAAIECSYCAPVSRVFATVGQTLRSGDTIVELSHPDVRAAVEAAQEELRQAREALQSAQSTYSADVDAVRAELQAAQAEERQARDALQAARQATPQPQDDGEGEAQPQAVDMVSLQVDYSRANDRRLRLEQRLADAQARAEEALQPYRRRVAAAEQAVADARAEQQMAMIRTPIDGQLIELNVGPGEQPGQVGGPMAVVADLSTLRVHAVLTNEQAMQVTPGVPATITTPSVPNVSFRGQVERINTSVEGSTVGGEAQRGYYAVIPFTNEGGQAKPQMEADVTLDLGTVTNVLVVPADAVEFEDDGSAFVNVLVGEEWVPRAVVVGLSDGTTTEIREGLDESDSVRVARVAEPSPQ